MPETTRNWTYCDNTSWYYLFNLTPVTHIALTSLLNIALTNAHKLKILPVCSLENIYEEGLWSDENRPYAVVNLTKLDEPSDSEVRLVEQTLKTVLFIQAVPAELYECVRRALRAVMEMMVNYTEGINCAAQYNEHCTDGHWLRGFAACRRFGFPFDWSVADDAIRQFNQDALLFYEQHDPFQLVEGPDIIED